MASGRLENDGSSHSSPPSGWLSSTPDSGSLEALASGCEITECLSLCILNSKKRGHFQCLYPKPRTKKGQGLYYSLKRKVIFFSSHQIDLSSYIPLSMKPVQDHKGCLILMETFYIWSLFLETVNSQMRITLRS